MTIKLMASELHINWEMICQIILEDLGKKKIYIGSLFHTASRMNSFKLPWKCDMVISHPPYSPVLTPDDFFLVPKVENALRRRRFQAVDDIREEFRY